MVKVIALLAALVSTVHAVETYVLHVPSRFTKDSIYDYTVTSSLLYSHKVVADGVSVSSIVKDFDVKASGVLTVLAVNEKHSPTQVSLALGALQVKTKAGMNNLLKVNDLLACELGANNEITYRINGALVDAEHRELMEALLSLKPQGVPNDRDDVVPTTPVKVNERWKVNEGAIISRLKEQGMTDFTKLTLVSDYRFENAKTEDNVLYAVVSGTLRLSNVVPPVYPGLTVTLGTVTSQSKSTYPIAGDGGSLAWSVSSALELQASGTVDYQNAKAKMSMRHSRLDKGQYTLTPRKNAEPPR